MTQTKAENVQKERGKENLNTEKLEDTMAENTNIEGWTREELVTRYKRLLTIMDRYVGTDKFGAVVWCDDNIREALEEDGVPITDENVKAIRHSYDAYEIDTVMIEVGWDSLRSAVADLKAGKLRTLRCACPLR